MKNIFKTSLLAASVAAASMSAETVLAAGFQVSETTASGMGRANAGEAARLDNAGVIAKNPAAQAFFEKQSFSGALHYIEPEINVSGTNTSALGNQYNADAEDVAPSAVAPNISYALPINEKWGFGFTINSRFGLSTEYPSNYAAGEYATESSIESIYLTPSFSYKFNDQVSIGLGVSYITGEGKLKNNSSQALNETVTALLASNGLPAAAAAVVAPTVGQPVLDLEADGDGFSWNMGLLWKITDNANIGFSYFSAVDLDTDADYTIYNSGASAATVSGNPTDPSAWSPVYDQKSGTLTLSLPDVAEVAYTQGIGQAWEVSASIQYTGWSSFEEIAVDDEVLKEENWDDAMRFSIGADYNINDDIAIRFGYAYDESAVDDENRTLSIPDADRNWYSFGGTFGLPAGSIDAALTIVQGKKVSVYEDDSGTVFDGELSKTDAYIASVAYNIEF